MDSHSQVLLMEDTTEDHVPTDADSTPFTPMSDPRSAALRVLRGSRDPLEDSRNSGLLRAARLRERAYEYKAVILFGKVDVDRIHIRMPDNKVLTTRCQGALDTAKAVAKGKSKPSRRVNEFLADLAERAGWPTGTLCLVLEGRLLIVTEEEFFHWHFRGAALRAIPHKPGKGRRTTTMVRFRSSGGTGVRYRHDDGELLLNYLRYGRDYRRTNLNRISELLRAAAECGTLPTTEQEAIHVAIEVARGNRLDSNKTHRWLSPIYGNPLDPEAWKVIGPAAATAFQNFCDMWDMQAGALRSDFDPAYDLRRHDPYDQSDWNTQALMGTLDPDQVEPETGSPAT